MKKVNSMIQCNDTKVLNGEVSMDLTEKVTF